MYMIFYRVSKETPRLLINREKCGESSPMMAMMGLGSGLDFDSEKAYRYNGFTYIALDLLSS